MLDVPTRTAVRALLGGLLLALVAALPGLPASARSAPPPSGEGFRFVQANLTSRNSLAKTQADLADIVAQAPDVVTLNEVAFRPDAALTPAGYTMWRTPGTYTGETPVLWRTDRWTATAQGTAPILQKDQIPKGRHFKLGMRYANWVTLTSPLGQTISVVSVHFTPPIKEWGDQLPRELRNLDRITSQLAAAGPVLVGGDLNVNYASAKEYPRRLLASYNLVPTYDVLGGRLATGDYRGATIDYTFVSQSTTQPTLQPMSQWTAELRSDHKALFSDWQFIGSADPQISDVSYRPSSLRNDPNGGKSDRRAVLRTAIDAIRNTPRGAVIHLLTDRVGDRTAARALRRAAVRGVHVQLVVRTRQLNPTEARLAELLGHRTGTRDWFFRCFRPGCRTTAAAMAHTALLISQAGRTTAFRMTMDRPLNRFAGSRPARGWITTDLPRYDDAFHRFFRLVR